MVCTDPASANTGSVPHATGAPTCGKLILGQNPARGGGDQGRDATIAVDAPHRRSYALNILISTMLFAVHGGAAAVRLV